MAQRLLFKTSPELRGTDVEWVQQRLHARGYKPGPIDGYYGPATISAVVAFQRGHELAADGMVGPHTWAALQQKPSTTSPTTPKPSPLPGRPAPGLLALEWMMQHTGMKESPPGSNRCPISEEFGLIGPWCAMAVSLAFKHGANLILGDQPGLPPAGFWPGKGFCSVIDLEAWCNVRGYWRGRTTPAAGMIAFYAFGPIQPGHVGIVQHYQGGGQFTAIEGNTGVGADADGGELMQRSRYASELVGLAWIPWGTPP